MNILVVLAIAVVFALLRFRSFDPRLFVVFGNHELNSIRGPGFWKIDLALSRLFSFAATQNVEVRIEAFNLLNNFNWGNPITNFSSGNFGRIQTQSGDSRIMQFGVKYAF